MTNMREVSLSKLVSPPANALASRKRTTVLQILFYIFLATFYTSHFFKNGEAYKPLSFPLGTVTQ